MAAPVSVIATTTAASGTGSASLNAGAVVNKFAIEVEQAQPGDGRLDLEFFVSLDGGQTYVQVNPDERSEEGNIFNFASPATNVQVNFAGNAPGNALTVLAYVYTD